MNLKLNCLDNVKGTYNSTSVEESKKLHASQTSAKDNSVKAGIFFSTCAAQNIHWFTVHYKP